MKHLHTNEKLPAIPSNICKLLDQKSLSLKTQGRVGDTLYYGYLHSGEPVYLKVGSGYSGDELKREAERLEWLKGNPIAPQLLEFWEIEGYSHLLILEIRGKALHEVSNLNEIQIVEIIAKALRMIHDLPAASCPFKNTLRYEIKEIEGFTRDGRLDVTQFSINNGKKPEEVIEILNKMKERFSEDTVTHGDFCLPNILVESNDVAGVVDWGKCGVADRHRDFSALDGSIKRNLGEKYILEFYNAYGISPKSVDQELINFYKLMDQFHYHALID